MEASRTVAAVTRIQRPRGSRKYAKNKDRGARRGWSLFDRFLETV